MNPNLGFIYEILDDLRTKRILVALVVSRLGTTSDDLDLIVLPTSSCEDLIALLRKLDGAGVYCVQARANDHRALRYSFRTLTNEVLHLDLINDINGLGSYGIRTAALTKLVDRGNALENRRQAIEIYRGGKTAHQKFSDSPPKLAADMDVSEFYSPRTRRAMNLPIGRLVILSDWVCYLTARSSRLAKQILFGFPFLKNDGRMRRRRFSPDHLDSRPISPQPSTDSPRRIDDVIVVFARYGARVLSLQGRRSANLKN